MTTALRLYLDFVRIGLMEGLAFRLRNVLNLVSYPVIILANYYLYTAVFENGGRIEKHTLAETVSYMVVAWTLRSIYWSTVDSRIGQRVRSGEIAIDLIRPVSMPLAQWCQSAGTSVQRMLTVTLPLVLLALFLIPVVVPQTLGGWLLLAVSAALGYAIMSLTKMLVGILAFYLEFNENLRFSFEMIQRLLGGLVIPLVFFPEPVFRVLQWLPFQYIYFVPAEVCLGKMTDPVVVLLIPTAWVGLLIFVVRRAMAAGVRRLSIQGG